MLCDFMINTVQICSCVFRAKTHEVVRAAGSAARNTLDSLPVWVDFQSLCYSQTHSSCQVSQGSQTQLCDPSRWGHDLQFEKLGFRWIQAPGWDLVCLIFISDCLCQYCSEAPSIDTDLRSMDELTTYTSLLLWTCLSPLLFRLTMWFDTVFRSLNLTL